MELSRTRQELKKELVDILRNIMITGQQVPDLIQELSGDDKDIAIYYMKKISDMTEAESVEEAEKLLKDIENF